MNKTLTINEKYSRHWPFIAVISAVFALLFYISYHFTGNVLLEGYLRLTAFGLFALALLSLFKLKDGKVEINIDLEESKLVLNYRVRGKIINEEEIELNKIETLRIDEMPNRSIYNDFNKSDRCVRYKRSDSENWIYLNEVHGRVIPLDLKDTEEIVTFVEELINLK